MGPPAIGLGRLMWIAVVLWAASNAFVTVISRVATWEGNASYTRMADLCRWDCGWYGSVLEHGYFSAPAPSGEANWPFHPLFPATAYPLWRWFKLSAPASMVLTSKIELLFAIYSFLLLISDQLETTNDVLLAGSLVAFNPYIVYAHAGYAEPLYFGLIALAFYFASKRRWILSGAMGGLASATRLVGAVFTASYCFLWGRDWKYHRPGRRLDLHSLIGLLLCPLGTALFMLYMYRHIGDALVQQHVQVGWHKTPGNPLHTLWLAFLTRPWPRVWGLMVALAIALSGWLVCVRKAELGIFLALSVLIPFSASYVGAPRYIWWEPPFLYAIYGILKRCRGLWPIYLAFASGAAAFMIVEWFSGHNFVV